MNLNYSQYLKHPVFKVASEIVSEYNLEAYVIGGGQIYSLALEKNLVDRMYITHVHAEFEADAFYPEFDAKKWDAEILLEHPKDEKHDYAFTIIEYNRKR